MTTGFTGVLLLSYVIYHMCTEHDVNTVVTSLFTELRNEALTLRRVILRFWAQTTVHFSLKETIMGWYSLDKKRLPLRDQTTLQIKYPYSMCHLNWYDDVACRTDDVTMITDDVTSRTDDVISDVISRTNDVTSRTDDELVM